MNWPEFLLFPFMQRALIAAVILALLLSMMGVFVILRRMSFFGDGIAHASLAGVAIGVLTGWQPLMTAIIFAIFLALIIYLLEKRSNLSSDALIGIFFTSSMALGVLLMNFKAGYQPELVSFLFGNILAITQLNLVIIAVIAFVIISFLISYNKKLTFLTIDHDNAYLAGVPATLFELLLYIFLAISVVLGVRLIGIVLVGALLIIPPSIAKLTASSFKSFQLQTVFMAELIVVAGLIISYYLDWPSGATIIVGGGLLFILVFLLSLISGRK